MKINNRRIKVIAENAGNMHGFNIYLDFSGQREFIVFHKHNGLLYNLLKDGIILEDLKGVINHLIKVLEAYMNERDLVCA